jgi:hypothetical protein
LGGAFLMQRKVNRELTFEGLSPDMLGSVKTKQETEEER